MAISMNWVKDYVDLKDVDLNLLAEKITKAGINVEHVEHQNLDHLIVGQIVSVTDHPNSDHLHICMVDIGEETKQIVCGASNVRENLKVIVALPGAVLPGDFTIQKSTIRGVESNGMLCALFELGLEEKTEENYNRGIEELDATAPVGEEYAIYAGLDDTIYELDLNPNRYYDCTNHLGFAYEVASVLGRKVTKPSLEHQEIKDTIGNHFSLDVATKNCTMYRAKMVKDVQIGESPEFIKQRLLAAGMRPINNVVDISNYVMLEYGQPLHFFDYDKLGPKIVVRMAKPAEEMKTLDGKDRVLSEEDIVITDGTKPVCIAGVMGGENTEVDENTQTILIESAIFNSYLVRYTSIRLDLRSEASLRYERGLNLEYCAEAIERACHLLEKYAGGKVLEGTVTYGEEKPKVKVTSVTTEQVSATLGMSLTDQEIEASLTQLGFPYEKENTTYTVTIPNRRLDVEANKADLIEEIGRIYGYDKIVGTLPTGVSKTGRYIGSVEARKLLSKRLRSLGLNEARTYTLISEEDNDLFAYQRGTSIPVLKPLSSDKRIIRQSIVASLLKVMEYNKIRNVKDIMIYEISNVYQNENEEETKIAVLCKGDYLANPLTKTKVSCDFYFMKGILENILNYLGLKNRYSYQRLDLKDMHPGMSAEVLLDREPIGFFGRIHPSLMKEDVYVLEISLTKCLSKKVKPIKMKEFSKYPDVHKDVAFIVDQEVSAETVMNQIKRSCSRLLTDISIFDIYIGENVEKGRKSLAFSLTFNDFNKTLTDEEVNHIFRNMITEVETKLHAQLRDK